MTECVRSRRWINSAIWEEEKKKEELKNCLSLCAIWIVTDIKFGTCCKAKKKNSPHWMENMTCMLSVPLKFWRGYQMTHELRAWCLMIGFLDIYPWAAKRRAWKIKVDLRHTECIKHWSAWPRSGSFLEGTGCVSGHPVSRQSRGKELACWA